MKNTVENDPLRRLSVEFLENVLCKDREILYLIGNFWNHKPAGLDMTSLAVSAQLQSAIKYCIKVRKTAVCPAKESNNSATV